MDFSEARSLAFHLSSDLVDARSLWIGLKAHPTSRSDEWDSATFLHLHLLTEASISLATIIGGSVFRSMALPLSVVMFATFSTVHPTRFRVHSSAAAGPVTILHGWGEAVVLVRA